MCDLEHQHPPYNPVYIRETRELHHPYLQTTCFKESTLIITININQCMLKRKREETTAIRVIGKLYRMITKEVICLTWWPTSFLNPNWSQYPQTFEPYSRWEILRKIMLMSFSVYNKKFIHMQSLKNFKAKSNNNNNPCDHQYSLFMT